MTERAKLAREIMGVLETLRMTGWKCINDVGGVVPQCTPAELCSPCRLRAALLAARRLCALLESEAGQEGDAGGWRGIESAPQDGTEVLAFMPSWYQGRGGCAVVLWSDEWWLVGNAYTVLPTHWHPLPPPPAQPSPSSESKP